MPFAATWMDPEIIIPREINQERGRQIQHIALICGILSMTQMNLSTKQKQTHRHREQTVVAKGEEGWEREVLGVWD